MDANYHTEITALLGVINGREMVARQYKDGLKEGITRFLKDFNASPDTQNEEPLQEDHPLLELYHNVKSILPKVMHEKGFIRYLSQSAKAALNAGMNDLNHNLWFAETFIEESLNAYQSMPLKISSDELRLIGHGSRVRIVTIDGDRGIRVPFNPHNDAEETRSLTKLSTYFGDYIPNPRMEPIVLDGIPRTLVTVDIVNRRYPLSHPRIDLAYALSIPDKMTGAFYDSFFANAQNFISACRHCYEETLSLPDLGGRSNVVYDENGRIFLLDLNNSFVTDIFALIYSPSKHEELAHISQRVHLASPDSAARVVFNHETPSDELDGKIIIPIDEKGWPAFDASLRVLLELEAIILAWDPETRTLEKDKMGSIVPELLQSDFYAPLRSERRAKLVNELSDSFNKVHLPNRNRV